MKRQINLVGDENEVIDFSEIEPLVKYFSDKGWKFKFARNKDNTGWIVCFQKETREAKHK